MTTTYNEEVRRDAMQLVETSGKPKPSGRASRGQ